MYKELLQIHKKTMDNPMDIHEEFQKLPMIVSNIFSPRECEAIFQKTLTK